MGERVRYHPDRISTCVSADVEIDAKNEQQADEHVDLDVDGSGA